VVCVAAVQDVIPVVKVPDYNALKTDIIDQKYLWSETSKRMKEQFPLAKYALPFLFDHDRDLEMLDRLSSYESLRNVMVQNLYLQHAETAYGSPYKQANSKCVWCDGAIYFATESKKILRNDPSWMWATIHCLRQR
jgi:hypothetical protein